MSIATQVRRIKTNIANSYTALEEKGATMPTYKISDNLASTIASLEVGGESDEMFKSIVEGTATDIVLPDNITKIANGMFYNTSNRPYYNVGITSIKANGVVELKDYCFQNQPKTLVTVEMPKLKKLGNNALYQNSNSSIKKLIFGALEEVGENALYGTFNVSESEVDISFSFNNCVIGKNAFNYYNLPSFDATGVKSLDQRVFNYIGKSFNKMWLPSTIETINAPSSTYSLLSVGGSGYKMTIYTDVEDENSVPSGWGAYWKHQPTGLTLTIVYGATYEDFLNA